jgi:2'-5' RNA ligase
VFFALVPPVHIRETLGKLALKIAERVHGRAVPSENIHLTLAFIGAWPVVRMSMLMDIGGRIAAQPIELVLDTVGAFRRAGVAWIGVSTPPPALTLLASTLTTSLAAAGVPIEARRFHPHLTLARRCRGAHAVETAGPYRWVADAMTLVASETRPEGSRYSPLATWALAKTPA